MAQRPEGLEADGTWCGMDANAFGQVLVDGDEHGDPPLADEGGGQAGALHHVDRIGDDGAVMGSRTAGQAEP